MYYYCRDDYEGVESNIWNKLFRADWFSGKMFYAGGYHIVYSRSKKHYVQRSGSVFVDFIDNRLEMLSHIRAYENIIALFEKENIDGHVMRYLERFYVYHMGVILERAIEIGNNEKMKMLKEKAAPYMDSYYQTNSQYPTRIEWVKALFGETQESTKMQCCHPYIR